MIKPSHDLHNGNPHTWNYALDIEKKPKKFEKKKQIEYPSIGHFFMI